jgi:hypothetical protein
MARNFIHSAAWNCRLICRNFQDGSSLLYNELNNLSTAGFYRKSTKKAGKYYEVERVIASVKKNVNCNIYYNFACFFFKYSKSRHMYIFKNMSITPIFYANI